MSDDGYGKYRRMLKMGIPRQQVNTSMLMDGKDPSKFSEQDPNEAAAGAGESEGLDLTMKGDVYDKYRKMLKCGLPMGAAMQAMAKDGVDPKGFTVSAGAGESTSAASAAPAPAPPVESATRTEDSSIGGGFLSELKTKAEKRGDSPGGKATGGNASSSPALSKTPVGSSKPAVSPPLKSGTTPNTMPPPVAVVVPVIPKPQPATVTPPVVPKFTMVTRSPTPPAKTESPKPSIDMNNAAPEIKAESPEPARVERPKDADHTTKVSSETEGGEVSESKEESKQEEPLSKAAPEPRIAAPSFVAPPTIAAAHQSKPVTSSMDKPAAVRVSEGAMADVLNAVLNENNPASASPEKEQASPSTTTTKSAATTSPASQGKKWTPTAKPAASNSNANDWKGLLATNRISVGGASPAAAASTSGTRETDTNKVESPSPVTTASSSIGTAVSTSVDSNADRPRITAASLPKPAVARPLPVSSSTTSSPPASVPQSPPVVSVRSSIPKETKPSSPAASPMVLATQPIASAERQEQSKVAAPVAVPKVTTPAVKPASTLKKRHSNDWKAMLAPYTDSPAKAVGAATPPAQPPVEVAKPPAATPASEVASPKVNPVGLNRSAEKRLPAWAVVEKPSFLVGNGNDGPKISEPRAFTVPSSVPVKSSIPAASKPTTVQTSAPAKPTTAPGPAAKPPVAATASTTALPPKKEYSTIPKGFQRKFAWEQ